MQTCLIFLPGRGLLFWLDRGLSGTCVGVGVSGFSCSFGAASGSGKQHRREGFNMPDQKHTYCYKNAGRLKAVPVLTVSSFQAQESDLLSMKPPIQSTFVRSLHFSFQKHHL